MIAQEQSTVSVIDLIDQLEGLFVNGRRIVFTPNVLVNEDEALDLIDRARMDLPEEVKQARWTVEQRERILGEADEEARRLVDAAREEARGIVEEGRREAERLGSEAADRAEAMIRDAQERAAGMVTEHAVTAAAEERARMLAADAEERAAAVLAEADGYARDVMGRLESQLVKTVETVRKGIERLPEAPQVRAARRRER